MKFFVYFDGYGNMRQAINEEELGLKYENDPDQFLRAMCGLAPEAAIQPANGHVGTLTFDNEKELEDFVKSLGDEIEGFYWCRSESRPYNF